MPSAPTRKGTRTALPFTEVVKDEEDANEGVDVGKDDDKMTSKIGDHDSNTYQVASARRANLKQLTPLGAFVDGVPRLAS